MHEVEEELVPYIEIKGLKDKRREALRLKDRDEVERLTNALVALYVYYGESYKMSLQPDPQAAELCLKEALKLKWDHPIANYRYAHLLYAKRDYAKASLHFKTALDGSRSETLNDTQALIAHIFTANSGILMAKEAMKEMEYLENNPYAVFDRKLKEEYIDRLLVESEDMVAQFLYMKITPFGGQEPISEEKFLDECQAGDVDVYLLVTPRERGIVYRGRKLEALSQTEFYVAHFVLMAELFTPVKDIYKAVYEGPLEKTVTLAAVRQSLSRLGRFPFWDEIIETQKEGNFSGRKRRTGIRYKMLCHCSVVLL